MDICLRLGSANAVNKTPRAQDPHQLPVWCGSVALWLGNRPPPTWLVAGVVKGWVERGAGFSPGHRKEVEDPMCVDLSKITISAGWCITWREARRDLGGDAAYSGTATMRAACADS